MKNINLKRFIPIVCVVLIIIVIIIAVILGARNKNNEESNADSSLNSGTVEQNTSSNATDENNDDTSSSTTEETSLDVPQLDTSSTNEYVEEDGSKIEEATVESIQESMKAKFKTVSKEDLCLEDVDLDSARFIFGEGVINIAKKDCFGFSVYVLNGQYLENAGTFAMSLDTEVLYRYDTETMTYIFVNMN